MLALPNSALGFIHTHFISLTSFMGIPNSMRILYKTSLPTESKVIEVYKWLIHPFIVFQFFPKYPVPLLQ